MGEDTQATYNFSRRDIEFCFFQSMVDGGGAAPKLKGCGIRRSGALLAGNGSAIANEATTLQMIRHVAGRKHREPGECSMLSFVIRNILTGGRRCGLARGLTGPLAIVVVAFSVGIAHAQSSDADLAKQLANPVSSLISVPFQNNYDCCFGANDASRYLLNIQPVVPVSLTPEWNLVIRTILPVISMGSPEPTVPSSAGLGDTVQSFFFSPTQSVNGVTWGVGPAFQWPTGNAEFGSHEWGAGPTAVILKQEGGWTYGILANHIWSYAGPSGYPDVSSTFLQPFLVYTFPDTTGIALNTESTYNWITDQWTVPINLMFSRIFDIGGQRVQFQIGPRFYATRPAGGPDWGARFNVTFLFPRK
jgi:hypothetical protein